ncbi:unnamed protein product [Polarella glacialis]|uniref:Uncharacterized protein n=1 Tax=Polarella glacialis TaxID=89957 RepID=A0A813GB44_POLGL|nr:unnamed protein product [Polarella glacialis]
MPPVSKIPNPRYVIERRSRARSAVTAALEGYRAESDSLGAATVIIGVLGPEEKNHLLRLLTDEGDGGVRQQADVALHLAKDPTPSVKKAVASACVAVFRFRAKSNQLLGTSIGPRLWRTASGQGRLKKLGRPSVVNNRKVCQTVRDYLLQHSSYTAKRIKVAGKIVQVRNLKRSRRALWTSSAQMQKLLCLRAWYTHLGKHQSHFKKLKCRSDVCTFCHKYDKVFLPSLRTLLSQSESKMIAHQPDYWKAIQVYWNSLKLQGKTDPDDQCSLQYVRAAIKYMRRMLAARAALPVPDVAGALGARLDFHKDEADAMAALAKANVILECCEHHFSGVKRQHGFREDKVDNLEHHCVDIQLDFMENMTTPLGPEEAQDWFWATARQSITTLGFYAHYWLNGVEHRQYFHFISDILNHDSAFAVQAFGDLLLRLGLSDQRTVLHVFADCGPHFRSYELLWCLVEVCKSKFLTVFLHFLLEHHGLQRRWAVDYARDHVISDVSDMKGALEAGAMMTMSLDPPPAGPSYHIVVFTPAAKPKFVDKLDNSKTDLQIEYTYCLRIQRHPVPMYVAVIKDFVYSDRSTDEQKGVSIGNVVMKRQPAKEESWRVSYRKTEPEKDNLNVGVLQRRLDHQKHAKLANLASRADPEIVKLARDQRREAKRKAKYLRQHLHSQRPPNMGIWKELSVKGDATEKKPLRPKNSKPKTSYVEKSLEAIEAEILNDVLLCSCTSKTYEPVREPDMLDTGFTVREISPQAMRIWLVIQVVGLLFQFSLWREVSSHLAEFEGVVARECAPQHLTHGVCAGPSWNTSAFQDFVLHHQEMHSFEFTTSSVPPTFLLVVDPVAQAKALPIFGYGREKTGAMR